MIRHGESHFNSFAQEFRKNMTDNGRDKLELFKQQILEFSDVSKNDFLIDAILNEKGVEQALN